MNKYLSVVLCLLVVYAVAIPKYYHKVVHKTDPDAKCLDGTPAFLYINEGGDTKNIMIYFLGGGMCGDSTLDSTLQNCYKRSKDFLGSEKLWPDLLPNELSEGYLSTDPKQSSFANWTKIFIPYCDGSFHQGNTKNPVKYKDRELFFRGSVNTRSHFKYINTKYNLNGADRIILTGMSAGGIAVHLWTNYLKSLVKDDSKVYPIADSGVFVQFKPKSGNQKMSIKISNLHQIGNADEQTPDPGCNAEFTGDENWKCLSVEAMMLYLKGRYMLINSEYDAWAIPNILQIKCLKNGKSGQTLSHCSKDELNYIETYRKGYHMTLDMFKAVNPDLSVWSISCSNHVYACKKDFYNYPLEKIPTTNGKTVKDVVEEYVWHGTIVDVRDRDGWPSNTGCAY